MFGLGSILLEGLEGGHQEGHRRRRRHEHEQEEGGGVAVVLEPFFSFLWPFYKSHELAKSQHLLAEGSRGYSASRTLPTTTLILNV